MISPVKAAVVAGLGMDVANNILFAVCRDPQTMVILNADDGTILDTCPSAAERTAADSIPATMEAFSSQGDGTLTVIKENSAVSFTVEQTVQTLTHAKTLTLDSRTGRIFLITADFTPPPATPPSGRPARGQMIPGTFSIMVVGK